MRSALRSFGRNSRLQHVRVEESECCTNEVPRARTTANAIPKHLIGCLSMEKYNRPQKADNKACFVDVDKM